MDVYQTGPDNGHDELANELLVEIMVSNTGFVARNKS